jgi:hypothetical protein
MSSIMCELKSLFKVGAFHRINNQNTGPTFTYLVIFSNIRFGQNLTSVLESVVYFLLGLIISQLSKYWQRFGREMEGKTKVRGMLQFVDKSIPHCIAKSGVSCKQ